MLGGSLYLSYISHPQTKSKPKSGSALLPSFPNEARKARYNPWLPAPTVAPYILATWLLRQHSQCVPTTAHFPPYSLSSLLAHQYLHASICTTFESITCHRVIFASTMYRSLPSSCLGQATGRLGRTILVGHGIGA